MLVKMFATWKSRPHAVLTHTIWVITILARGVKITIFTIDKAKLYSRMSRKKTVNVGPILTRDMIDTPSCRLKIQFATYESNDNETGVKHE